MLQILQEPLNPILMQHPDGRNVQRTHQGFRSIHNPVVILVVIFGTIISVAGGDIGNECMRKDFPAVLHHGIKQRFQNAPGTSWRRNYVDIPAISRVFRVTDITGIGQDLPGLHLSHQAGCIPDTHCIQHIPPPLKDLFHLLLVIAVNG